MVRFSVPPGYRRSKPVLRPKLEPFIGVIEAMLDEDTRRPSKQRHTSKRIFERLRDEHGFAGEIEARHCHTPHQVHAVFERKLVALARPG